MSKLTNYTKFLDIYKGTNIAIFIDSDLTYKASQRLRVKFLYKEFLLALRQQYRVSGVYYYSAINSNDRNSDNFTSFLQTLAYQGYLVRTRDAIDNIKSRRIDLEMLTDIMVRIHNHNPQLDVIWVMTHNPDFDYPIRIIREMGVCVVTIGLSRIEELTENKSISSTSTDLVIPNRLRIQSDFFFDIIDVFKELDALELGKERLTLDNIKTTKFV